jgi:hypothetical protein
MHVRDAYKRFFLNFAYGNREIQEAVQQKECFSDIAIHDFYKIDSVFLGFLGRHPFSQAVSEAKVIPGPDAKIPEAWSRNQLVRRFDQSFDRCPAFDW